MPTKELIERAIGRDKAACAILYGEFNSLLYSVIIRVLHDSEEAKDALQVAWVKVFGHLYELRSPEDFRGWCCRISINVALDWLKKRNSLMARSDDSSLSSDYPDTHPSPLEQLELEERAKLVGRALGHIPERYRQVLFLHYFDGLSVEEIAAETNLTEANVRQRLSRGRKIFGEEYGRLAGGGM